MRDMTDSLNAAQIAAFLRTPPQTLGLEVVAETGSTNADLRARAAELPGPWLLAAEAQTAGRGRAGRVWQAAAGDSLCFSIAWPFAGGLSQLTGLSLAIGVALADALRSQQIPVQLKWPNDVLLNGAKLGGVLIETASSNRAAVWAVIGIGLNVRRNLQRDTAVDQALAALEDPSAQNGPSQAIDRNQLLAELADTLVAALQLFEQAGLAAFVERWHRYHAHGGLAVDILENGERLHSGTARGIDVLGCLILDTQQGPMRLASGDVSLRPSSQSLTSAAEAGHAAD